MATPRYDSQKVRRYVDSIAGHDEKTVLVIADPAVPQEAAAGVSLWLKRVLGDALIGQRPDLSLFPKLALREDAPRDDLRWKVMERSYRSLIELGAAGRILAPTGLPTGSGPIRATATQDISDGEFPHFRLNDQVRGVLWASIEPKWIEIGWDLPADERDRASHTTIINGLVDGSDAALVFWNANPSIIRVATPERLRRMIDRSIGVPGVRHRWHRHRSTVDGEEIRGAIYLASKMGRHPGTWGTSIAEELLPRRVDRVKEIPDSFLAPPEGTASLINRASGDDNPEYDVLRSMERAAATQRMNEIISSEQGDDKVLLEALYDDCLAGNELNFAETARRHGFDPAAVEASWKRIKRRYRIQK